MLSILNAFKADKPKRTENEEHEIFFNTFSPEGTFNQNRLALEAAKNAGTTTESPKVSAPEAKLE